MRTRLLIISSLLVGNLINAAILRVSKDATYLPHYSEIQAAIDGSEAGDSIYVYPGSYGNATIKKEIAIFGVGYFLVENAKESLTKFVSPTKVGTITFKYGSNNSIISGLYSGRIYCDTVSNINISGNRVNGISLRSSNNIHIHRCYSDEYIDGANSNGVIINNNIIANYIAFDSESSLDIYNNYSSWEINVSNSNIYNNINNCPGSYWNGYRNHSQANCLAKNNIYMTNGFGTAENNNFQSNSEQIYPKGLINDNYRLTEGSTAIGKGIGGVDCGPFGGDDPYCLSGINYIPTISTLNIPNQASNTSGLKLNVIVKSNN